MTVAIPIWQAGASPLLDMASAADGKQLAGWVKRIRPDRVQLNIVARRPAEDFSLGVPASELARFAKQFSPAAEFIAEHPSRPAGFCGLATNGSDVPGTLLDACSAGFRARLDAVDLIISHGPGNHEPLAGVEKHICSLLKVKCPVLAASLHCPGGSLMLEQQPARQTQRQTERAIPTDAS